MFTITIEDKEFIEATIKECKECFVGMIDREGLPYVIPMNFGYKDDCLYLHSAPDASSVGYLTENPQVCITFCTDNQLMHQNKDVACSYRIQGRSVVCRGKVIFVEDYDAKIEALNILMAQYTENPFKYSEPSVKNVKVWKVNIEKASGKKFGASHAEAKKHRQ